MLKKVSNKENVFMFFRDKLKHGPFPKLKTAIFIKIAKIIKNQTLKIGLFLIGLLNFEARAAENVQTTYAFFLLEVCDFLTF